MGKTKPTKKFEKKHLKGALEKRKEAAKVKQRHRQAEKKKAKRPRDIEAKDDASSKNKKRQDAVTNMSVEEFLQGSFDDIINAKPSTSKSSRKLGKRKRDDPTEDNDEAQSRVTDSDDGDDSDLSMQEDAVADDSDEGPGDEDDLDIGMSKKAMDDLAKQDPEFYNFLKKNDPEALDFDVDLPEVDGLSASEDEERPKKKKKSKKGQEKELKDENELTAEMVARWKVSLEEKQSLHACKELVLAFRSAAHLNDGDEDGPPVKYSINSPDVYNDVLVLSLKQIPVILQYHVPVKESASGKVHFKTEGKKFKNLTNLLKMHTNSILHLLTILSDDDTLKATISALNPLLPYLLSFRKLIKSIVKAVVNFWARPISSDSARITAFLVLRKLVVIGDKGIRELTLKSVYQGLLQGCRTTNASTIQGINLMKNSAAELWGIDQQIGYTTAFTSIRQLAIHLRNCMTHNEKESYKQIYNWQYVHALDFWACMLSQHCSPLLEAEAGKESPLRQLIYPCVQVTIGAMRLVPSATYFPLRFHLIRSLLMLSRATDTFIPVASYLLECLDSTEMRKKATPVTKLLPLEFALNYKAQKAYLRTKVYQDGIGEQLTELLAEFYCIHCKSIAFPELALPAIIMLKRWLKAARKKETGNGNSKVDSGLVILVQKIEANSKFIEDKRAKVDFTPKDRAQVDAFLRDFDWAKTPLGAFVESQRTLRAQRREEEEIARREEKKRQAQSKKKAEEAVEDDSFGGFEDDEEGDAGKEDGGSSGDSDPDNMVMEGEYEVE